MFDLVRRHRARAGIAAIALLAGTLSLGLGIASAHNNNTTRAAGPLPCEMGGTSCSSIGYTRAWLGGRTVKLEYSHAYFCEEPPTSGAGSHCELGKARQSGPTSGAVVSPLRVVVPLGFTPPASTLQCPTAGQCIDHPSTIDLSRVFGAGTETAALPPHSHILVDAEVHQSTWWPVRVIGVQKLRAWNRVVSHKSEAAVKACQKAGNCTADIPTNLLLFFQVLQRGSVIK
jgi:hypothetical protein